MGICVSCTLSFARSATRLGDFMLSTTIARHLGRGIAISNVSFLLMAHLGVDIVDLKDRGKVECSSALVYRLSPKK
jgi:hypothetical protein